MCNVGNNKQINEFQINERNIGCLLAKTVQVQHICVIIYPLEGASRGTVAYAVFDRQEVGLGYGSSL